MEVSVTAISSSDASDIGVSTTGTAVALALGLLELGVWASAFISDSQHDSLGATWDHLGPSGQGGPHQVWVLLEATLVSYYPMIVAPPLDPPGEAPEAIQMEAGGLVEEVLDAGHKVQWPGLLDLQGFLLMLEEEIEELFPDPGPVSLREIVHIILVIDLQNVSEVPSPPTAVIVRCQPRGILEGGPFQTSPLRLGFLRH